MNLHFLRSQVYITSVIIIQIHGYVLLAANLNDFKSVAKKLVPEKLADQLADLASHAPVKVRSEEESEEYSESSSDDDINQRGRHGPKNKKDKEVQLTKINFEELVQKVKERIQKDLGAKSKTTEAAEQEESSETEASTRNKLKRVTRFVNKRKTTTESPTEPDLEEQDEEPVSEQPPQNDDMTFAKINLKENDSYQDYATPAKEKNIYESDDEKQDDTEIVTETVAEKVTETETTTAIDMPEYTNQETESPMEYAYDDKVEELKAKTEDLWYDYQQANATEDYTDTTTPLNSKKTTKKSLGTMIPKRDYYKISSPNYFAKIPVVAEKYDFDEPIPEKYRQPENLKPIKGLPQGPAIINGKIKVSG